jgi:hypothetical protein
MKFKHIPLENLPETRGFAPYQHFYPLEMVTGRIGIVEDPETAPSSELIERIIAAYRYQQQTHAQEASGVWSTISGHKSNVHEALMAGDTALVTGFLSDPAKSMIMHGFDTPTSVSFERLMARPALIHYLALTVGSLRRLCEALGALRMAYPEGYGVAADVISNETRDIEDLAALAQETLDFDLRFPNCFRNEIVVETSRGGASYRAVQSLYQAWKAKETIAEFADGRNSAVEVGGGTGRTAYYANRLGISDYTIVDLPLTGVVQAYFLGTALGPDKLTLEGEKTDNPIKLVSPPALPDREIGLMSSFDALVEFSAEAARGYIDFACRNARAILSVNRESKSYSVHELLQEKGYFPRRTPSWMRNGYVEEVVRV